MKKQLIYAIILIGGLVCGGIAGSLITKNYMQNKNHDNIVEELNRMSKVLQEQTAEFYASNAYNVYGELLTDELWENGSEVTINFIADFLSSYNYYLINNGLRYTIETEKDIRNGKAIPQASNKEHYINKIKWDAQNIAESHGEQFRKMERQR